MPGARGGSKALDQLVSIVYPERRHIARQYLSRAFPIRRCQSAALANEAYLYRQVRLRDFQERRAVRRQRVAIADAHVNGAGMTVTFHQGVGFADI